MHKIVRRGRQNELLKEKISRRQLLRGAGAAAIAGSVAAVTPVLAHDGPEHHSTIADVIPTPEPIPGGVEDPAAGFLHWFLPGPPTATTPFIGLPGFGLDAEPSMITDYHGFTAFAVISGQAWGSDGKQYNCEFDVRVMQGEYFAADGSKHYGTFAFF